MCYNLKVQYSFTWSSIVFTPSGPSSWIAWPIRSVRPQLSMRKPRSRLNLSAAAFESRRLKEVKQHSGLRNRKGESEFKANYIKKYCNNLAQNSDSWRAKVKSYLGKYWERGTYWTCCCSICIFFFIYSYSTHLADAFIQSTFKVLFVSIELQEHLTWAVEVHSPVQEVAVGQSVSHHHCPLTGSVDAPHGP